MKRALILASLMFVGALAPGVALAFTTAPPAADLSARVAAHTRATAATPVAFKA